MDNAAFVRTARIEGLRLYFDIFKHLTTLSSGSIVLLLAFLRQITQPDYRILIGLAFSALISSTVASVVLMLSTARHIRRGAPTDQLPDWLGTIAFLVSVIGFGLGMIFVSVFATLNF